MYLNEYDNITSNTVRVRDLDRCRAIIDQYEVDGDILTQRIKDSPAGTIAFRGNETWPAAVQHTEMPPSDDFDGCMDTMCEKGEKGFMDLLARLGPYLESRLVILGVQLDGGDFLGAQEWIVCPGATTVETKRIDCEDGDDGDNDDSMTSTSSPSHLDATFREPSIK